MNFNYSNKIYSNWVDESKKIFSKWSDSDFFSDKAEHIYFYSVVNDESVDILQKLLQQSSKTKTNNVISPPKPIIIHLNSVGGSVLSMNLFNVILTTIRVPLCVIIESQCYSAATLLSLLAPYRVMIDFSTYMIHDMYVHSQSKGHEILSVGFITIYQLNSNYLSLLKDRTNLSDSDIKTFMSRDILISSSYCLKKKIIDRILKFPKIKNSSNYNKSIYSDLSLDLSTFLKKTNLNHAYIDMAKINDGGGVSNQSNNDILLHNCNSLHEICVYLDSHILNNNTNIIKPLLIHFKPLMFEDGTLNDLVSLQYRIALIQKKTPVFALIEGPQALDTLSLILMCPVRIMMTPSTISSSFSYSFMGNGQKTIDILYNSKYILKETIKFFKKFSILPARFYDDIQHKIIHLKPKDLLEYNIVQQILNFRKITPLTLKNIEKYYNLENLTKNYKNIPVKKLSTTLSSTISKVNTSKKIKKSKIKKL